MSATPTELIHFQLSTLHTFFCFPSSSGPPNPLDQVQNHPKHAMYFRLALLHPASTWKTLTSQTCMTSKLFSSLWMYRNSSRLFQTSVMCVCVCVCVCACVSVCSMKAFFYLQITSVKMGADQLVPYVCQGLGSLHGEQQETQASVLHYQTTIASQKSLLVFHTHMRIRIERKCDGAYCL